MKLDKDKGIIEIETEEEWKSVLKESPAAPSVERWDGFPNAGVTKSITGRPTKELPTTEKFMSNGKNSFLERFGQLTGATKSAFGAVETTRKGGSESELDRAVRLAFSSLAREERCSNEDHIRKYLQDNPDQAEFWDVVPRLLGGCKANAKNLIQKGLFPSDTVAPFPIPVSPDIHNLLSLYGAYRDLGLVLIQSQKTRFAKITGYPDAAFITPTGTTLGSRTIPTDTNLSGSNLLENCNTIATIIEASEELLADGGSVIAEAILTAVVQGLAKRLDYACFQGDGTDDQISGTQTGIFVDTNITTLNAAPTSQSVIQLLRDDFLATVGQLPAGALQRPCRWYINPIFIPTLLRLKDGPGNTYFLKTPAETQGEWHLVGFPVTWAAQAPGTDGAAKKVAAFGEPRSYLVALREELELMQGKQAKWSQCLIPIRALMRGRVETRDATGFAVLKTAA